MEPLGVGLGVLIGIISGTCLILLLRTALARRHRVKGSPWVSPGVLVGLLCSTIVFRLAKSGRLTSGELV